MTDRTQNSDTVWGEATQFFFSLTPDKILDVIEEGTGLACTGRVLALNSMENRVYEVEVETDKAPKNPSDKFKIAKFYRPGRWSQEQILEEHQFLQDLEDNEIPVVAPIRFKDGSTVQKLANSSIYFSLFPKISGRSPDELNFEQLEQVGRLLARMHQVGASRPANHRINLNPKTYGLDNLNYLLSGHKIPLEFQGRYQAAAEEICKLAAPQFAKQQPFTRVHGDCHLGNLIFGSMGMFWVDFDDMVVGPPVQDLWLMLPGRDDYSKRQMDRLLCGYETMRTFDNRSLKLVEILRALRFIHFSAWISKRWEDPAFPKAFAFFGSNQYWQEQTESLEEQLLLIV